MTIFVGVWFIICILIFAASLLEYLDGKSKGWTCIGPGLLFLVSLIILLDHIGW